MSRRRTVFTSRNLRARLLETARKAHAAWLILKYEGPGPLLRQVKHRMKSERVGRPDECGIAFRVLDAERTAGVMIDVGAHFGESLAPFAHRDWRVFAFEPDAQNRKRLAAWFGRFANVTIDPRAVSDREEEAAAFYRSPESTGISALFPFRSTHKASGMVQVTTLERFLEEQKLCAVDFLKVDTEGHDLFVLRGFPWKRSKPRLVLCEFEDSKTRPRGYTFHDMARFLQGQGYRVIVSEWSVIHKYGEPCEWTGFSLYPCELRHSESYGNLLATADPGLFASLLATARLTDELDPPSTTMNETPPGARFP